MFLVLSLIALQLFDIAIHVGTGQAEAIRILSNVILGVWALWSLFGKTTHREGIVPIVAYLSLNGWFLASNGITNPEQDGALRITLFVLVCVSATLAVWLRVQANRN